MVIINKADGELKPIAMRAKAEYQAALRMLGKNTELFMISCYQQQGLQEVKTALESCLNSQKASGEYQKKRNHQLENWFKDEIDYEIRQAITAYDEGGKNQQSQLDKIRSQGLLPSLAARDYVHHFLAADGKQGGGYE